MKKLISFNHNNDTYSISADAFKVTKTPFEVSKGISIGMFNFESLDDSNVTVEKNGKIIKNYGEYWAGGNVTGREYTEYIMTLYVNELDKNVFNVISVCAEMQKIKEYYDKKIKKGSYYVDFLSKEILKKDIESKQYVGYIYADNTVMLNRTDRKVVTDYSESYLEIVTDILDNADEDVSYFQFSVDELKDVVGGEPACKLSFAEGYTKKYHIFCSSNCEAEALFDYYVESDKSAEIVVKAAFLKALHDDDCLMDDAASAESIYMGEKVLNIDTPYGIIMQLPDYHWVIFCKTTDTESKNLDQYYELAEKIKENSYEEDEASSFIEEISKMIEKKETNKE